MSDSVLTLHHTPLFDRHVVLGARMVPFAGYAMPVQYEGVLTEHKWTRDACGLFDVSHMGQARLEGSGAVATLEALTPTDFTILKPGRQRYSLLLNDEGGILDDWMVSRPFAEGFLLVVNAACKDQDFEILGQYLASDTQFEILTDRALIAMQGPKAADVMSRIIPEACGLYFMDCGTFSYKGEDVYISRSGYTGEDGFEVSLPNNLAATFWDEALSHPEAKPIGLGARDSLRLEAGMPLYGHEMDKGISPVESGLSFGMSPSRLKRGDVRGGNRIIAETDGDLKQTRVGLKSLGGPPAREGAQIVDAAGTRIGHVTSGVPSPSLGVSIAMGYVQPALAVLGTRLKLDIRGKTYDWEVVAMPFITNSYHRKPA